MNSVKESTLSFFTKEEEETLLAALQTAKEKVQTYVGHPSKEFRDKKVKEIENLIRKIKGNFER